MKLSHDGKTAHTTAHTAAMAANLKEKCLKPLFGAGNDGGVVTEEQSSDYSNKDYRKEIALAAFICICSH